VVTSLWLALADGPGRADLDTVSKKGAAHAMQGITFLHNSSLFAVSPSPGGPTREKNCENEPGKCLKTMKSGYKRSNGLEGVGLAGRACPTMHFPNSTALRTGGLERKVRPGVRDIEV
jgi:hypothetical protein